MMAHAANSSVTLMPKLNLFLKSMFFDIYRKQSLIQNFEYPNTLLRQRIRKVLRPAL